MVGCSHNVPLLVTCLTRVLDSSGDKLPILDHGLEHLRDRMLVEDTILLALNRQTDVYGAALRSRDFCGEAVLGQV